MLDKNTVANLNLNDVVRVFCLNDEQCSYVTEILCKLQCDVNEIRKIQDTIKDYVAFTNLIPDVSKALGGLEDISEKRSLLKRNLYQVRSLYEDNQRKKTRTIFGNLSDVSRNILLLLRLYLNMNSVLGKYNFSSDCMRGMQARFRKMTGGDSFRKLGEIVNKLSNIERGNNDICLNVFLEDEVGKILVEFVSVNGEKDIPGISSSGHNEVELINRLTGVAAGDLCDYLNSIMQAMTHELEDMHKSLMFYRFAVNYVENLKMQGIPFVYPSIVGISGEMYIKNMYSLNLIAKNVQRIVPCNVKMDKLTVIYGANNTGKTCYVRGLALAYVFAQAGLPLPAEEGYLCPVSDILSQFASGEKDVGRFEEELREVDEIFDRVDTDTLVIFNETFQSTVYEEIAEPYKDILDAMVEAGAHALVVTHNKPFIELCRGSGDVKLLRMNEEHEIEEVLTPK